MKTMTNQGNLTGGVVVLGVSLNSVASELCLHVPTLCTKVKKICLVGRVIAAKREAMLIKNHLMQSLQTVQPMEKRRG